MILVMWYLSFKIHWKIDFPKYHDFMIHLWNSLEVQMCVLLDGFRILSMYTLGS